MGVEPDGAERHPSAAASVFDVVAGRMAFA
jgi:hypothetical protein